jgi:hypothetical protein
MPLWLWIVLALLIAVYLLLRFNLVWIRLIDRAWRNPRDVLPPGYERPRYFVLGADGEPDPGVRWPGWDGWYFFVMPHDRALPVKMIRGSLMTGLYGLEGIDNYERLQWRLSTTRTLEYLSYVPVVLEGRRSTRFSQQYLPRWSDLRLRADPFQVSVGANVSGAPLSARASHDAKSGIDERVRRAQGRIEGTWPHFRIHLADAETGTRVDLSYEGECVLWWADAPGIFTYFAAIGTFEGSLSWERPHEPGGPLPEPVNISGRGSFEHGFARKPFGFDPLFLPVRLLRRVLPGLRPIRYHYELFLNDDGSLHGGFMKADGFGFAFRNHGGVFQAQDYVALERIRIDYEPGYADRVSAHCGGADTLFHRRWRVRAETARGMLEYTGSRTGPPAHIANGMIYYDFAYEGTFDGRAMAGRGYGEYVHL